MITTVSAHTVDGNVLIIYIGRAIYIYIYITLTIFSYKRPDTMEHLKPHIMLYLIVKVDFKFSFKFHFDYPCFETHN